MTSEVSVPVKRRKPRRRRNVSTRSLARSASAGLPAAIRLLGQPPVLPGEKVENFNRLLADLAREHAPGSFSEWLLLFELAGVIWTRLRFRRAQTALFVPVSPGTAVLHIPGPFIPRYTVEDDEDEAPPEPPPVPKPPLNPKEFAPRLPTPEPKAPTDLELGTALKDKIDVFARSEAIIASLDRRSDLLMKRLKQMKDERTRKAQIIDVNAETLDPRD